MIICLCHGQSDRDIISAIEAGASSVEDLQRLCGAGTSCGACKPSLAELFCDSECARGCRAAPVHRSEELIATAVGG